MIPNFRLYAAIGSAILVGLILAWALRVDHLRAVHLKERIAVQAAFDATVADVRAKTELARLSDAKHKADVEAAQNQSTARNEDEIRRRIAAAVAAVRVRAGASQAHPGSGGGQTVPQPSSPAGSADGAGSSALVPASDLETCAENTIKAEGWQSFWRDVSAIAR